MAARLFTGIMRAIRIHQFGGPEVLTLEKECFIPKPTENQILINCKAAGVNPVDTYIRAGSYANLPPLPYTPGKDGAGIVEDVGSEVKSFKKGDRVCNVFGETGTYAEYFTADAHYVFRLHDAIDFQSGAAIGVPYATAYRALVLRCHAKQGQTVLVHGASGAVGLASCQIAQALGLTVIGTAGTQEGMELVKQNGAAKVYNHREDGYTQKITEETGGVNIILEMLASENLAVDCTMCKFHGQIAVIGSRTSLDFAPRLLMAKELTVHGVGLMTSSKEDLKETEEFLYKGQAAGWLKPVIGKIYSLDEAVNAHKEVIEHSSGTQGKIILEI